MSNPPSTSDPVIELKLNCWVIGDENILTVSTDSKCLVNEVLQEIKTKMGCNDYRALNLDLYKVSMSRDVFYQQRARIKMMNDVEDAEKLLTLMPLCDVYKQMPPATNIHIIVVLQPPDGPPHKRPRLENESLSDASGSTGLHSQLKVAENKPSKISPQMHERTNSPTDMTPEEMEDAMMSAFEPYTKAVKELLHNLVTKAHNLLLDNLGLLVDKDLIEKTFLPKITVIVYNASGSGKTRLVLDGLCHHWGIYFTMTSTDQIGSSDISSASEGLRSFQAWDDTDLKTNHNAADRWLGMLFCARLFVLRELLKLLPPDVNHKRYWTLLQCNPRMQDGLDVFRVVMAGLRRAQSSNIEDMINRLCRDLLKDNPQLFHGYHQVAGKPLSSLGFFVVLDEAQNDFALLSEPFQVVRHPFVHAFYQYCQNRHDGIILSGTSFNFQNLFSALRSQIAKQTELSTSSHRAVFKLGLFSGESLLQYAQRYISFEDNLSHKRLKERLKYWLHGRHRFAASFIEAWRTAPKSPHRVLTAFVEQMTNGFILTDAQDYESEEPELPIFTIGFIRNTAGFPAEQLTVVMDTLLDVFMRWSIGSKLTAIPIETDHKQVQKLIDLGVGYLQGRDTPFNPPNLGSAYLGEPLAVLWLSQFFGQVRKDWIGKRLRDYVNKTELGFTFEQVVMMTIMEAFSDEGAILSDIFHVQSALSGLKVRLVTLKRWSDGELAIVPVSWTTGCLDRWGFKAESSEESIRFFTEPCGFPFLFPDTHMGPGLFFFGQDEASNELIAFGVQCKCKANITPGVSSDALNSLSWDRFYKVMKDGQRQDYMPSASPTPSAKIHEVLEDILGRSVSPPTRPNLPWKLHSVKASFESDRKTPRYIRILSTTDKVAESKVVLGTDDGLLEIQRVLDYVGK